MQRMPRPLTIACIALLSLRASRADRHEALHLRSCFGEGESIRRFLAQRFSRHRAAGLTVTNVSLRGLRGWHTEMQDFQMDGGPSWSRPIVTMWPPKQKAIRRERDSTHAACIAGRSIPAPHAHRETRSAGLWMVMVRSDGRLGLVRAFRIHSIRETCRQFSDSLRTARGETRCDACRR